MSRVSELRAALVEASKGWATLPACDAFPGENAHQCRHESVEASRRICEAKGLTGFVVWRGTAYFRAQARAALLANVVTEGAAEVRAWVAVGSPSLLLLLMLLLLLLRVG